VVRERLDFTGDARAKARIVQFYSKAWNTIGCLKDVASDVCRITGVHEDVLSGARPLSSFSIAQRMSWASPRKTSREEDRADSLLGIFDVHLGVVYGEGRNAFQRLQQELLRTLPDDSIFVFEHSEHQSAVGMNHTASRTTNSSSLLADSPFDFRNMGGIAWTPKE